MRILVVDDDDTTTEMLENALVQSGYEVTVAQNGRKALDLVRSGLYRLVVSDWEMPEMSGIELCRHIRRRYSSGYVYVILLTARPGTQNIVDGLNAGADDFISKPFEPQELCVRIRAGERILSLESREVTIFSLAKLAESRDPETGAHLEAHARVLPADRRTSLAAGEVLRAGGWRLRSVDLPYQPAARHRQGRHSRPDPAQARPVDRGRVGDHGQHTIIGSETLDAATRAYPEAQVPGHGPRHRPLAPRVV